MGDSSQALAAKYGATVAPDPSLASPEMKALAEKYGATATPVSATQALNANGQTAPEGSAAGRAAGGFWDNTLGGAWDLAKGLASIAAQGGGQKMIDPNSDGGKMITNIVYGHADQASKAKDSLQKGDYMEALGHSLATVIPFLGPVAAHIGETLGGTSPQMDRYGNITVPGKAPDVAGAIGQIGALATSLAVPHLVGPVVSGATKAVSGAMDADPAVALTRALKPPPSNSDFAAGLPDAMADIKTHGGDVVSNDALKANSKVAMNKAQAALETWMQQARSAKVTANGNPIAKATADALPDTMWLEDPKAAQNILATASKAYSRDFSVDQLRKILKEKNAELSSFYDKSTGKQNSTVTSGAPQAVVKAQRDAIADTLYKALDPQGQGAGPREIQSRYGAMKDLAEAADKRTNAINAEKPVSKLGAATSTAAAIADIPGKVLHGQTEGALSGLLSPFRGVSDPLIKRAFSNVGDARPFPAPPAIQSAAPLTALPAGTAPFTQGIVVPDIAGKPGPMTGRMIEAGQQPPIGGPRAVPPTDMTNLEIVDAAKKIARDPKTGRVFRYYTSDAAKPAAASEPVIDGKAAAPVKAPTPKTPPEPEATPQPEGATISVAAPDGSVHWFTNQQSADMFKQLAGIK